MINSLWISKTGMEAQQTQLDVISHNLANVSTTGYKRANAVFEDLMYQNLRQVGANSTEQSQLPTGLQLGLGVRTVATSRSFSQGSMQQTNNQFDLALSEASRIGNPNITHSHVARAISLVRLGRREEAREAIARILDINPHYGRMALHDFGGNNLQPALAHEIRSALRDAGLATALTVV